MMFYRIKQVLAPQQNEEAECESHILIKVIGAPNLHAISLIDYFMGSL